MKQLIRSYLLLTIILCSITTTLAEPIAEEDLITLDTEPITIPEEGAVVKDFFGKGYHAQVKNVQLTPLGDGNVEVSFTGGPSEFLEIDNEGEGEFSPFGGITEGKLVLNDDHDEVISAENLKGSKGGFLEIDRMLLPLEEGVTFSGTVGKDETFLVEVEGEGSFKRPRYAEDSEEGPYLFKIQGKEGEPFKINPETFLSEPFRDGVVVSKGEIFYTPEGKEHPIEYQELKQSSNLGDFYITNDALISGLDISLSDSDKKVYLDFDNNELYNLEQDVRKNFELSNGHREARYENERFISFSESPALLVEPNQFSNGRWPPSFREGLHQEFDLSELEDIGLHDMNQYYDTSKVEFLYGFKINTPSESSPLSVELAEFPGTTFEKPIKFTTGQSINEKLGRIESLRSNIGGSVSLVYDPETKKPSLNFIGENTFATGNNLGEGIIGYSKIEEDNSNNHIYFVRGTFEDNGNLDFTTTTEGGYYELRKTEVEKFSGGDTTSYIRRYNFEIKEIITGSPEHKRILDEKTSIGGTKIINEPSYNTINIHSSEGSINQIKSRVTFKAPQGEIPTQLLQPIAPPKEFNSPTTEEKFKRLELEHWQNSIENNRRKLFEEPLRNKVDGDF